MGTRGCALLGTGLSARDPPFPPSLHVEAALNERAPEIHVGDSAYLPNAPQVAQICGYAPSIAPSPQALPSPPEHTLPLPQADGGHRPPCGTTQR